MPAPWSDSVLSNWAAAQNAYPTGGVSTAWTQITDTHVDAVADPLGIVDSFTYASGKWTVAFTQSATTVANGLGDPVPVRERLMSDLPELFSGFSWDTHTLELKVIPITYLNDTEGCGVGMHIRVAAGDGDGIGYYDNGATNQIAYRIGVNSTATIANQANANMLGVHQYRQQQNNDTLGTVVESYKGTGGWSRGGQAAGNNIGTQALTSIYFGVHALHATGTAIGAARSLEFQAYMRTTLRGTTD